MEAKIRITELNNGGDGRGSSFTAPKEALKFLGQVFDMHIASTGPSAIRGNHYHLRRREAIVVLPGAAWSLHWDEGEGTTVHVRQFDGSGAILVLVSPGASHAVRNDDEKRLWLVALSSEPYDPGETVRRNVT